MAKHPTRCAPHLADVVSLCGGFRRLRSILDVPADISEECYSFDLTGAGTRTAGFAIAAVIARPIGGIVADKIGPRVVVAISLGGAAVMSLIIALRLPPEIPAGTSFVVMALFLGLGTGGVFAWVAKLAPAERVGAITGIVGAAGGLGGSSRRSSWVRRTTSQRIVTPPDWCSSRSRLALRWPSPCSEYAERLLPAVSSDW
jgi:nitrate/nitrite transporter NarK